MYVRCNPNKKNVKYLSYVRGFRDKNGKVKQITIEKIGDWNDLIKKYDDPIAHFQKIAKEKTKEETINLIIKNINDKKLTKDDTNKNLGYSIIKNIYNSLDFKTFFKSKENKLNIDYSLNDIFLLLILSRIIYPSSKKDTYMNKDIFFDNFDFSLKDLYRSLDHFNSLKEDIQSWLWNNTKNKYNRDTSTSYFDCTNFYFEISYNDEDLIDEEGNILEKGYRKKGVSKEHRTEPIIQFGLFMDKSEIPLSFCLFPGNESEKTQLRPLLKKTKNDFNLGRIITVADRGLNTSDNAVFIAGKNHDDSNNDGYVFGQSILGADTKFKEWALNQDDYIIDDEIDEDGNVVKFKHKSRIIAKTTQIIRDGKRNNKFDVYQKQMVYYSSKYTDKQKYERDLLIIKAKDLISNPSKYTKATSYGAAGYINNISFDKNTGAVTDGLTLSLNEDKIKELEQFDGYYSIVTSELNLSDKEIRDIYKGLWKIEETFKITKSNLKSRPVFVWTKEHIEAHFLTCFVSLVIIRLLEKKINNKYSIKEIIKAIKNYSCQNMEQGYYNFNHDETIIELGKIFGYDFSNKYMNISKIKKFLN